jgi:hypothetical protein
MSQRGFVWLRIRCSSQVTNPPAGIDAGQQESAIGISGSRRSDDDRWSRWTCGGPWQRSEAMLGITEYPTPIQVGMHVQCAPIGAVSVRPDRSDFLSCLPTRRRPRSAGSGNPGFLTELTVC